MNGNVDSHLTEQKTCVTILEKSKVENICWTAIEERTSGRLFSLGLFLFVSFNSTKISTCCADPLL